MKHTYSEIPQQISFEKLANKINAQQTGKGKLSKKYIYNIYNTYIYDIYQEPPNHQAYSTSLQVM